jgi:hypothetical protein
MQRHARGLYAQADICAAPGSPLDGADGPQGAVATRIWKGLALLSSYGMMRVLCIQGTLGQG